VRAASRHLPRAPSSPRRTAAALRTRRETPLIQRNTSLFKDGPPARYFPDVECILNSPQSWDSPQTEQGARMGNPGGLKQHEAAAGGRRRTAEHVAKRPAAEAHGRAPGERTRESRCRTLKSGGFASAACVRRWLGANKEQRGEGGARKTHPLTHSRMGRPAGGAPRSGDAELAPTATNAVRSGVHG
jgi:hypothetical protein